MMRSQRRPVYLVVRYEDPFDKEGLGEDRPLFVLAIKQTSLAAEIEAAKHTDGTVKKGFVTY